MDIKREILKRILRAKDGIRYRDGRPSEIENDLYNYHLKQLVKSGYIEKLGYKYYLTNKGKKYIEVEVPLDPQGNVSDLFRVNILAIVYRNNSGQVEILNQTRTRHPYYGDSGVIGGAVQNGEFIANAANRKLIQETGLSADFKLIGVVRKLRYDKHKRLFSDILFHICISNNFKGELKPETEFGENSWVNIDIAINNENISIQGSPKVAEVLQILKENNFKDIPFFYIEEEVLIENFK
jgi:ADP-ribose pyrophosphatase YjhB (NUDIX family)